MNSDDKPNVYLCLQGYAQPQGYGKGFEPQGGMPQPQGPPMDQVPSMPSPQMMPPQMPGQGMGMPGAPIQF